jgi:hypothetical protein
MNEPPQQQQNQHNDAHGSLRDNPWLYGIAIAVLGGLVVWGIIAFDNERDSREAQAKADELSDQFAAQGLNSPDDDVIVRLLGTDGGRVCDLAGDELSEAALKLHFFTNGAGGPGARPGPVDERLVTGAVLIADVYCPEKLEEIRDLQEDFDFSDVIKE